jgi:ectoine hydroxylase-related dioxygenase (phytanoyl-CoA dioxygenase family)
MQAAHALRKVASPSWADVVRRDGYCVIRNLLPSREIGDLGSELAPRFEQTPFCQGHFYGYRTKRFHGLLKRSRGAAALVLEPTILKIAEDILLPHCDAVQLNLTQAVEIHPGGLAQIPHRDEDMWAGEKGRTEYLLNVMWPLDPFTPANGGTRLWPGSHLHRDKDAPANSATCPTLMPGDALVFLGSTLHGGGANRTPAVRRGILLSYCLGWLKPFENMWLTYPPQIARDLSPELRDLIGYRLHRPNLGNYDGQCPSILLDDGDLPEHLAAIDAFAPPHQAAVAEFAASQISLAEFPQP